MPLKRTPPTKITESPTPATDVFLATPVQLLQCSSEPNLTTDNSADYGTPVGTTPTTLFGNTKRKRLDLNHKRLELDPEVIFNMMNDMKIMISDFKTEQNAKYDTLITAVEDFRSTVDFLLTKNETLQAQVDKLEVEKKETLLHIESMENKIESLERTNRATCLEVRNIPTGSAETKRSLSDTIMSVGRALSVEIQTSDIKDVYRIKSKDPNNKTIIVDLSSVLLKETILNKYRRNNREHSRLSSEKLKIPGPSKPIFISENLSARSKKLFYLAREFAKAHSYKFCWTTNGKIFLRERENGPLIRIEKESDLTSLSPDK